MSETPKPENPKQNLIQEIIDVGTKAFDPASDETTRDAGRQRYNELIEEYV